MVTLVLLDLLVPLYVFHLLLLLHQQFHFYMNDFIFSILTLLLCFFLFRDPLERRESRDPPDLPDSRSVCSAACALSFGFVDIYF